MEDGEKLEALKSRFISLCSTVKRDGMDALMEWLEKSDFYTAPASSRFHGCYRGGLIEHSLNVYDALVGMVGRYPDLSIDPESVIVVALFHDLTKANYYAVDYKNVNIAIVDRRKMSVAILIGWQNLTIRLRIGSLSAMAKNPLLFFRVLSNSSETKFLRSGSIWELLMQQSRAVTAV